MKAFGFNDKSIRRAFIKKVYSILMAQLLVTMSFISLFLFHQPTKLWVQCHVKAVFYSTLAPVFMVIIIMACCEKSRRVFPMNFILLSIFTICESIMLGIVTSRFDTAIVMLAVGITAAVCLTLTLFALQTKLDFTTMGSVLLVFLSALIFFGICTIFIPTLRALYASLGAILFSFYIIYDTQMMMGGHHKHAISPEEYIFAAVILYLDILNMFLFILRCIGIASK